MSSIKGFVLKEDQESDLRAIFGINSFWFDSDINLQPQNSASL